jgi:glutamate synthase domain-containing protein 1
VLGDDLGKIWPLIYDGQSDSASFDNALELLVMGGYSVAHAMMMMIPEAWENHGQMDPARRAFYEYHAAMMEPWDGPALLAAWLAAILVRTVEGILSEALGHYWLLALGLLFVLSVVCLPRGLLGWLLRLPLPARLAR